MGEASGQTFHPRIHRHWPLSIVTFTSLWEDSSRRVSSGGKVSTGLLERIQPTVAWCWLCWGRIAWPGGCGGSRAAHFMTVREQIRPQRARDKISPPRHAPGTRFLLLVLPSKVSTPPSSTATLVDWNTNGPVSIGTWRSSWLHNDAGLGCHKRFNFVLRVLVLFLSLWLWFACLWWWRPWTCTYGICSSAARSSLFLTK